MRNLLKNSILLLLCLVLLGLSACNPDSGSVSPSERVVATLDDDTVLYKELEAHAYLYSYLQNLDLDSLEPDARDYILEIMLQDLVSMEAMRKTFEGREAEVLTTDALTETETFLETLKADSEDAAYVKAHNITDGEIREFCNRQHFATAYIRQLESSITDLEQRVADYYEANKESYRAADASGDVVQLSLEQVKEAIKTVVLSDCYKEAMEKLLTETYQVEYLL